MKLSKIDKKYIWHPFTQMKDWLKEEILVIDKAKGTWLYDINGRKYFDGVSSLWVTTFGHKHPYINKKLIQQLKKLDHSTFLGLSHPQGITLAEKLINLAPKNLKKVFFSDNGSTACEVALKMAFQYWQLKGKNNKNIFLALKNSYHGDTIGSVSVGGIDLFHKRFRPLLFKTIFIPSPYCYRCKYRKADIREISFYQPEYSTGTENKRTRCRWECLQIAKKIIEKNKISALIVEPLIQAAGGMIVMPGGYLSELEKICKENNILLIFDEVATGFGRTGKLFASEWENSKPDFLCISKGITGGYLPLAATLTTREIFDTFLGEYKELKTFFHGHTYTANPLAAAAANANIDLFIKTDLLKKLQYKILFLKQLLQPLLNYKHVGEIRQIGMMVGIEIVKKKNIPFKIEEKIGIKICHRCRDYGLILRPLGNVIVLMPPLVATLKELKFMIESLKSSMIDVLGR